MSMVLFSVSASSIVIESENKEQEAKSKVWNNYFCFTYDKKYYFFKKHEDKEQAKQNALIGNCFTHQNGQHRKRLFITYRDVAVKHLSGQGYGSKNDALFNFIPLDERYWLSNCKKIIKGFRIKDQFGLCIKTLLYSLSIIFYFKKKLIKECFLLRDKNINFTYQYTILNNDDTQLKDMTILTFLLLEIKKALQKKVLKRDDKNLLQRWLSFFKFFIVECNAHLFARDDNNYVPMMMLEQDEKLKSLIENYFSEDKNSLKKYMKLQINQRFCMCENYKQHIYGCTNPIFDAIANYDKNCLQFIVESKVINFKHDHYHAYTNFSTFSLPIRTDEIVDLEMHTPFQLIVYFQQQLLLAHMKLISPCFFDHTKANKAIGYTFLEENKSLFFLGTETHFQIAYIIFSYFKDDDIASPYLAMIRTFVKEEQQENYTGVQLESFIKCFDPVLSISQHATYTILKEIIYSGYEKLFFIIQASVLCNKDLISIVISYYGYFNEDLPEALASQWENRTDYFVMKGKKIISKLLSNVKKIDEIDFKNFSPEQSIFNQYHMKHISKESGMNEEDKKSLETIKKGYYELLRIKGFYENDKFEKIFDEHYTLFLKNGRFIC